MCYLKSLTIIICQYFFVETSKVKKMGKTPEDIDNKLLKKNKKLEQHIKQLNEESKKIKNQITELECQKRNKQRKNLEITEELQKERKKSIEEKGKLDQQFKNEVQIRSEISKSCADEIKKLEIQLFAFQKSNESKDTKIIELTEETLKLKLVNKQLEAEKKREAKDKHYYFVKFKIMEESFNSEKLKASSVHTISPPTSFSSPLPTPPPPQSPLPSQPTSPPPKEIQIAPSPSNLRDFTAKVYLHYAAHKHIITRRMRDITSLRNMPHQNINHLKMDEFLNDLQTLSEKNDRKTFLKAEKFYKSQIKEKFAWMKPEAKKKADAKLQEFFNLVESVVLQLKIDDHN